MTHISNFPSLMIPLANLTILLRQWWKFPDKVQWTLVSTRIVIQVQLMVILCVVPAACHFHVGRHWFIVIPLLCNFLFQALSDLQLLLGIGKHSRSVLCALISTLSILGSGIVHLPEEFQQLPIRNFIWVEQDQERLGVTSVATTNCSIARCRDFSTSITNSCIQQALAIAKVLAIQVFHAPEAASCYGRLLGILREVSSGEGIGLKRQRG